MTVPAPANSSTITPPHTTLSPPMSTNSSTASTTVEKSNTTTPSIPSIHLHHPPTSSHHHNIPNITRATFHDSNLVIKCRYGKDFRRIPILKQDGDLTYDGLCVMIHRIFKSKLPANSNPTNIILKYTDEDGDLITLENDSDLVHALPLRGSGTLKITAYANEQEMVEVLDTQEPLSELKSLAIGSKSIPLSEKEYDIAKEEIGKIINQLQSLSSKLEKKPKSSLSSTEVDDFLKPKTIQPTQSSMPPSIMPPQSSVPTTIQHFEQSSISPRMQMPPQQPTSVPPQQYMRPPPQGSTTPQQMPPMLHQQSHMPPPHAGPGMPSYHRPPPQGMNNTPSIPPSVPTTNSPYHQPPPVAPYGGPSAPNNIAPMMPPQQTGMPPFPQQTQQYQYPPPPSFLNRPN